MGDVLPFTSSQNGGNPQEDEGSKKEPDAPDWPTDEPRPPQIDDPPPAPDTPYVVGGRRSAKQEGRP